MKLRRLKVEDAKRMYEWMTDKDVNKYFRFDPKNITIDSCKEFIKSSFNDKDRTYAITEDDKYLGSISLKNIDNKDKNAELAISIRKDSQGRGLGYQAINEILKIGFEELNLNKIYLNVLSNNERAIKLYEKVGFEFEGELKNHIFINGEIKSLKLYGIWRNVYHERNK